MTKIIGKYLGSLRNELEHKKSSKSIITDAPSDNNGKGESFSPTDLVAAALGSCMLTIIGIRANSRNIEIGMPTYTIVKHMLPSPRKIKRIEMTIEFLEKINCEDRIYLEKEARNCPVALSLNSDLMQDVKFKYS